MSFLFLTMRCFFFFDFDHRTNKRTPTSFPLPTPIGDPFGWTCVIHWHFCVIIVVPRKTCLHFFELDQFLRSTGIGSIVRWASRTHTHTLTHSFAADSIWNNRETTAAPFEPNKRTRKNILIGLIIWFIWLTIKIQARVELKKQFSACRIKLIRADRQLNCNANSFCTCCSVHLPAERDPTANHS